MPLTHFTIVLRQVVTLNRDIVLNLGTQVHWGCYSRESLLTATIKTAVDVPLDANAMLTKGSSLCIQVELLLWRGLSIIKLLSTNVSQCQTTIIRSWWTFTPTCTLLTASQYGTVAPPPLTGRLYSVWWKQHHNNPSQPQVDRLSQHHQHAELLTQHNPHTPGKHTTY